MAVEETAVIEQDAHTYRFVESLYLSAKKAKDQVTKDVKRYEDLWRGKHWKKNPTGKRTQAVSNFIFSIIETEVTWLTENRPSIIVVPQNEFDTQAAKVAERIVLDYLWPGLDIRSKLKRMTRSALVRGKGFLKVTWDNELKLAGSLGYTGDVRVDYINWHEIYLDPKASSMEDARYIIHARVMPLSEIVRKWPEKGPLVKPDPAYSDLTDEDLYNADVDRPIVSTTGGPVSDDGHRAMVLECWLKDDSYELREEMGVDEKPIIVPHFLYPRGRLIIVANGVVLVDDHNPYHDGEFPFVSMSGYETDDSPWDMGEVEQLEPIQRVINILESRFVDNARLMTNTVWVKSEDAGIAADKITNEEGAVYTIKNPRARFERVPPQPLPQHYFTLYQQLQRNMETITGIHDITQGRRPVGITAATAISLLQEASQARIRDKAKNMEDAIRHLGTLMLSRIVQFYTPERVFRLRGEDGQYFFQGFDAQTLVAGLDMVVEAGSSLQMNEQQRYQMAIELFQAGGIDIEGLLEASGFPGRDEIIKRMRAGRALMPEQPPGGTPGAGIASGSIPPLPGAML